MLQIVVLTGLDVIYIVNDFSTQKICKV